MSKWITYNVGDRTITLTEGQRCEVRVRGHWYVGKVAVVETYAAIIWYTPKNSGWEQGTVIPAADVPLRVMDRDGDNAC